MVEGNSRLASRWNSWMMMMMMMTPSTWNFGSNWLHWSKITDFQSMFTRSASAVAYSKISLINTNKKSTTRFPMSLRWTSYVAPKSPKGGSKTQNGRFPCKIALRLKKVCYKVSLCETCQRKVARHSFVFLPNSIALLASYVTVVEDRPIMSVKYCLPVPVFHFCPKLTHPAARSLCDSWAICSNSSASNNHWTSDNNTKTAHDSCCQRLQRNIQVCIQPHERQM